MANLILNGSTSGSVTLSSPAVSGTTTLTLPTTTGTVITTGSTFAGTGPAFSAYAGTTTSITTATFTKVALNTENFDTNSNFDSVTNYRFTPTVAGYYQINGVVFVGAGVSGFSQTFIYKNGSAYVAGNVIANSVNGQISTASDLINFNGSTDYVELYVYQNSGSPLSTVASSTSTKLSGSMIRSA
jgi:hypothetical protein